MAVFAYTQTDNIIGTLTNGMKLVSTTVTVTDANVDATTITVKPLERIIGFSVGTKKHVVGAFMDWNIHATTPNAVQGNPAASANTAVIEILSFGY
jgi:hypothetical protein